MVEIPDELRSVFSGTIREQDGEYIVEVPETELAHDAVTAGETYRIAVLDAPAMTSAGDTQ